MTTPSQTIGPFLAIALRWPDGPLVVDPQTPQAIWLRGRVLDGNGEPVTDALVETWQADPEGAFDHPAAPASSAFRGFGRSETTTGEFAVCTRKPGQVPALDGGWQAPHVDVSVFARGLLDRLVTRVYFADEPAANAQDPVLTQLSDQQRTTLLAHPTGDGYRIDLVLQGTGETVFFDL